MNEGVAVVSRIRRRRGSLFDGRLRRCVRGGLLGPILFCGSAVDAASDFLFDDAVLLFDLVRLLLALLRSVWTATAGRPRG